MPYNDMTGALFRNERKTTEKQPDYKGSAIVDAVEYWVSGWINESKDGKKYMSLRFEAKEQQASGTAAQVPADPVQDDEIPF